MEQIRSRRVRGGHYSSMGIYMVSCTQSARREGFVYMSRCAATTLAVTVFSSVRAPIASRCVSIIQPTHKNKAGARVGHLKACIMIAVVAVNPAPRELVLDETLDHRAVLRLKIRRQRQCRRIKYDGRDRPP